MNSIEVRNPATGEKAGSVTCASPDDVAKAVAHAREAQAAWTRQSVRDRVRVLDRFHDLVLAHSERICDVIQSETGKARRDALTEVATVAGTARYYAVHGVRAITPQRRRGAVPFLTAAEIVHRPHGVVGLITPWNYPFLLPIADALPALLAGNAVVIKPSELTPLSAELGRELLNEAGFPPRLVGVVHGSGDIGAELLRHVDYAGFTGGSATGRKVAVAAAERMVPFSLELGGKNPMIVLRDAPIESAASALVAGAFANAGQACISIERVYVEEPVFETFARSVAEKAAKLKVGWSRSWEVDMGSLIHAGHAGKVLGHIEDAVAKGAAVLAGGRARQDLGPCFVEPTVLANVSEGMQAAREETFGPVVSLYSVKSREEAIVRANDTAFGLNASVWSGGAGESREVARQIEAGSVGINATLMGYSTFDVPMGGVKQSGVGRRHGPHGILRYTSPQSIVTSFGAAGGYDAMIGRLRSDATVRWLLRSLYWWRRAPGIR